ncbi:RbsB ABC-type sugar transport system, periplasmic component [Candidatus Nanopelagicaceae bacterium]
MKTISAKNSRVIAAAVLSLGLVVGGTTYASAATPGSCKVTGSAFSTDEAKGGVNFSSLTKSLGAVPKAPKGLKMGSLMKFLGNQYWIDLAAGQKTRAKKYGVKIDVQAAASESDQVGQLNSMQTMVQKGYKALLVSPQSNTNLCPAVEKAEAKKYLVLNVNDGVLPGARQWVGPNQISNGVLAAEYFIKNLPAGSEVANIQGQVGAYAAIQRTKGFVDTAKKGGLDVVASVPGNWDVTTATNAAAAILKDHPNLKAFYANNDGMALGVATAVNNAGLKGKVLIIGTDGISDAYTAIKNGDITGTVDSYPNLTGQAAVDVALRLLGGQKVPRAVYTPVALITSANVNTPAPKLG